jgi:hypothetical protein
MRRRFGREADAMHLAVCSEAVIGIAAPVVRAGASYDGEYTRKRVLTKGPADDCPADENVSVTINGDVLTFINSQLQNYAIGFYPKADGTFTITHVDADGNSSEIKGRVDGGVIAADVDTPPACITGN